MHPRFQTKEHRTIRAVRGPRPHLTSFHVLFGHESLQVVRLISEWSNFVKDEKRLQISLNLL